MKYTHKNGIQVEGDKEEVEKFASLLKLKFEDFLIEEGKIENPVTIEDILEMEEKINDRCLRDATRGMTFHEKRDTEIYSKLI